MLSFFGLGEVDLSRKMRGKNMEKLRVLLTAESDDTRLKELYQICDIEIAGWKKHEVVLSEDELIEKLKYKDVFVTSYDVVTRKVIETSPSLKLIVCTRANPVNVDTDAAREKNIPVIYTPGRNSDATAEFAVALMLNIARNIPYACEAIKNGSIITDDLTKPDTKKKDVTWGKVKDTRPYVAFKGMQLKNKTVGIVGYGSIGRRVAKILLGFGMHLLIFDPFVSRIEIEQPGVEKVDFETLLERADFVTCHTKVTETTEGLFNRDAFERMKETAYFINNSRGAIVNESDLIDALRNRTIAGAALDVFEYEPLYKGHPFVNGELDNIIVTPHIGGAAKDSITNHTIMFVDDIKNFYNEKPMIYRFR